MTILKSMLPGSMAFLLIGLAIGLLLSRRAGRTGGWGRRWLVALTALYVLMSTPAGSLLIAKPLSWGFHPIARIEDAAGARAVVVLDGGTERCYSIAGVGEQPNATTLARALEAVRVATLIDAPLVVVTGGTNRPIPGAAPDGDMLRQAIVRLGVPADRVVLDPDSTSTRAHALSVTRLLRARGISRFVLVTSDTHIRRAAAAFRREGADLVASPASGCDRPAAHVWRIWPSSASLAYSEAAVHDYLGLIYYGIRGWL
jgi:uncharacterized SAM-binding protein YcdF (DUF218 family)